MREEGGGGGGGDQYGTQSLSAVIEKSDTHNITPHFYGLQLRGWALMPVNGRATLENGGQG